MVEAFSFASGTEPCQSAAEQFSVSEESKTENVASRLEHELEPDQIESLERFTEKARQALDQIRVEQEEQKHQ